MTIEEIDAAIEDLKARREQLLSEQTDKEEEVSPTGRHVVVIGGQGQLGRLFVSLFDTSGYEVTIIEKDDWETKSSVFQIADLVLVAVPINITPDVINQLPALPGHCVLADITSIKQLPLTTMMAKHSGPVVGLHPMFGPDVSGVKGQTIIVCDGRGQEQYQWLIDQLDRWGGILNHKSAEDHDKAMALIQVLRHFSTVAYGHHLNREGANLGQITELSSPIYRLELAMVGRLFAQDPELYTDIIFSNPDNVPMMQRYIERFGDMLALVEKGDKKAFMEAFEQTTDWFGEYANQFLAESTDMLAYKKSK